MTGALTWVARSPACRTVTRTVPPASGTLPRVLALVGAGVVWLVVADCAVACLGYVASKCGAGWLTSTAYAAGHGSGLALLLVIWRSATFRRRLGALLTSLTPTLNSARGLLVFLALVTALRVAWVLLVPTQPTSDNAVYHGLATRLVQTGVYETDKHRAYWPPGYPAFLAVLYAVCGSSVSVAKLGNVALAGIADLLTWRVVRTHAGPRAAVAALLLTAAWPGRNLHVDVLSYDELAIALLLASLALLPHDGARRTWPRWIGSGVVLGLACLVRPTLGLLPLAVGGWLLVRRLPLQQALRCMAVYTLAMLVPIVPWAIRNAIVLHHFVPLTTNAGGNFYNSWAPGGTGSFYKPAWEHLHAVTGGDELKLAPTGFALGLAAIRDQPAQAAWRVAQKQVLYLGSDNWLLPVESYIAACGAWAALGVVVKLSVHTLTNAWFVLLMLTPLAFGRGLVRRLAESPLAWLALSIFASGLLTHTVFEAQARYHLIYLPLWSILLALVLTRSSCAAPAGPSQPAPCR